MEYLDIPELIDELEDTKNKLNDCIERLKNNQQLDKTQIGFLQSINIEP